MFVQHRGGRVPALSPEHRQDPVLKLELVGARMLEFDRQPNLAACHAQQVQ